MRPLPSLSSPSLPCLWTRPSLTSNRSAKSASTTISTEQIRGLFAEVLDLEVFAHPAADVAAAEHHEVRVGATPRRVAAQHEHRAERVGRGRGERLGRGLVEREPELGHETRVAEEQALRVIGIDLARTARDAERRAFDERDDAVGSSHARARARRPRLRHCATVAGRQRLPFPARTRVSVALPCGRCESPLSRRCGFPYRRRDMAASSSSCRCSPTASSTPATTSRCSRAADRGPRRRSSRRCRSRPTPHDLGNPWYDGYPRARVVPPGRRVRRRAPTTPASSARSAARCCDGQPAGGAHAARAVDRAEPRRSTRSSPDHVHLVADQRRAARRPTSTSRMRAPCTTASTSRTTRTTRTRNDSPRLHRSRQSRQGADGSDHDRSPRRPSAAHDPQARRAARARVLRARGRAAARVRRRAVRERHPRREDRAARPGERDGVPDPVARAVRARDDRGDGVRHAGDHDQLGRRARARRGRRHRFPARQRGRPRRDGRPRSAIARPGRVPQARRVDLFSGEAMVRGYEAVFEEVVRRPT